MIVPIYQRGNMSAMVYIVWLSSAGTVSVVVGCYTWIRAVWLLTWIIKNYCNGLWTSETILYSALVLNRAFDCLLCFLDALTPGFFFILHKPIVIIYMHTLTPCARLLQLKPRHRNPYSRSHCCAFNNKPINSRKTQNPMSR